MVWVINKEKMRLVRHMVLVRNVRGVYRVLVEKPEGKRPFGRSGVREECNIKTDLQEMVWGSVDWIGLAQDMDKWLALGKEL
jgi:hypothetical protein